MDRPLTALLAPRLVIGVDPDSAQTALCWAVREVSGGDAIDPLAPPTYSLAGLIGGGSTRTGEGSAPWTTITGQLAWLRETLAGCGVIAVETVVIVESQPAHSPRSSDVEPLRRVRYHLDAACELLGIPCVHVEPASWERAYVGSLRGRGAIKRAYQAKAREETGGLADNEDKAAAWGIVSWYVGRQGGRVVVQG